MFSSNNIEFRLEIARLPPNNMLLVKDEGYFGHKWQKYSKGDLPVQNS